MATTDLTQETFQETIEGNDIVLVDWWADWCGPCKMFAPVYDEVSQQHEDIVFGKIDTEDQQQLAAAAGISSIPTLMAFRENVLVFSQPGAINAQQLAQLIEQVRGLDMEDVHKQVEEARQQAEQQPN
ncbi:MAG TPA: thioredoxin [Candidatus Yaniella excrementavium]|nr:thioredoxin [Candidatus Yaniella excrementavium]